MKKITSPRIPVTRGLKDIYAMDMHLAYHAACAGQLNVTLFSRLAAAIAVIRTALAQKQTNIPNAIETLDATIEILVAVKKKGDETAVWEIVESERPAVIDGIVMAEECIGTLDVALLEQTAQKLLQILPQPE